MTTTNEEPSLYDTMNKAYKDKIPICRLVYMAKIVQPVVEDTGKKKKDKEKLKELSKEIIPNFISDLKKCLNSFETQSNVMIIFVGTIYAFVGIENSTSNIFSLIKYLKNESKMTEDIHVINYNEECPYYNFPVWYKYEGEVYEKESQIYKDFSIPEKAWTLYDNYFCNFGCDLREIIKKEEDFENNNKDVVDKEVNYVKYFPTKNEVEIFEGDNFQSLDEFIEMYINEVDVEFDNDLIYPYYWPINV
jgi:hypothetical protein